VNSDTGLGDKDTRRNALAWVMNGYKHFTSDVINDL
jgi:hypothetical protein